MQAYCINVASEATRRALLEGQMASHLPPGWRWTWVDAVTPASLDPARTSPGLKPGENACYQSHQRVIGLAAAAGGHALVLEDDVLLGPQSAGMIEGAIRSLPEEGWDLLFTDVAIPDPEPMLQLFLLRRRWQADGRVHLLDLRQLPFCGSTAYVINSASLSRVAAVANENRHGLPYDLLLRQAIYEGRLQGRLIFPFATTVSAMADASQIQAAGVQATDLVWNAYRRLVWAGQDLDPVAVTLAALPVAGVDAESALMGRILAEALSPALVQK
ncbi:MAG: hypothetical protein ABIX37_02735 [Gammaproteobacteria bacterium]